MSSKERFTRALKSVFTVRVAVPPPPPSSRRPQRPTHGSVPPLPPRPEARESVAPAAAEEALGPRAQDSLVPVRFTDLLDAPERDARAPIPRRTRLSVIGAFVAGAVVMLALQVAITGAARPVPAQPVPLAAPHEAVKDPILTAPAQAPTESQATRAPASSEVEPSAPPPAPSTVTGEFFAAGEPATPPASAVPSGSAESPAGTAPAHHRRKRSRSLDYEPPTAEFPEP